MVAVDGELHACRALLGARCEYFRTLLYGCFREGAAAAAEGVAVVDLRPYGIRAREMRALLHYLYVGRVMGHERERGEGGARQEEEEPRADLHAMEPSLALALLPHASALLMDDLKRLCEAVLVAVVDEENAEPLLEAAEQCFAEKLRAACADRLGARPDSSDQSTAGPDVS